MRIRLNLERVKGIEPSWLLQCGRRMA